MNDLKQQLVSRTGDDLKAVEAALLKNLNPHLDFVKNIAGHIIFSGGKRLRPLLMMVSSRVCGYSGSDAADFSTIFEYLHAATLLHDDVVDGALLRRGKEVAHRVWDAPSAVLTGDFLLARSLELAADTGSPEIIRVIAGITAEMSQGEIEQLLRRGDSSLSEFEYLSVIRRKTAVLIEGACKTGALLAGASEDRIKALSEYGHNLGIAFQMADDLLDYTTDAAALGKNPGADLREGKMTLPVIFSLSKAEKPDREFMVSMMGKAGFSAADFMRFVETVQKFGGIDYTRNMAVFHVSEAKKALDVFKRDENRETLEMFADYALLRKS